MKLFRDKYVFYLSVMILVGLSIRVFLSWMDFRLLIQKTILDDTFYILKLAQNIASGYGFTFDGINPTNGFQVLQPLMLVFVFKIIKNNLILPIHISLWQG